MLIFLFIAIFQKYHRAKPNPIKLKESFNKTEDQKLSPGNKTVAIAASFLYRGYIDEKTV